MLSYQITNIMTFFEAKIKHLDSKDTRTFSYRIGYHRKKQSMRKDEPLHRRVGTRSRRAPLCSRSCGAPSSPEATLPEQQNHQKIGYRATKAKAIQENPELDTCTRI